MNACPKCGQRLADGINVCPSCGFSSAQPQYGQPQYQQPQYQQPQYQQPQYQQQHQQPQYQQPQYQQPQYQQQQYQQPYNPGNQQPYMPVRKPKIPGRGFGISSMVLGIIGAVGGFSVATDAVRLQTDFVGAGKVVARVNEFLADRSSFDENSPLAVYEALKRSFISGALIYGIVAVLAVIFALVAIFGRKYRKGQSVAGLILGGIAVVAIVIGIVLFVLAINDQTNFFEQALKTGKSILEYRS